MAVAGSSLSLGEYLVREGIITSAQLTSAQERQKETAISLGRVLVDLGYISEATRLAVLQKAFGFDVVLLKGVKLDPTLTRLIPQIFAQKHHILPIRREGARAIAVAMEDPSDVMVVEAVRAQIGLEVKAYAAAASELREAIQQAYVGGRAAEPGVVEPERGALYRAVRYAAFPVLTFLPWPAFILAVMYIDRFHRFLLQFSGFDVGLGSVLIWALWTVTLYEINGLVFHRRPRREAEESS